MNLNEAFPSKYLAKEDLDQKNDTIVTITHGGFEEVGSDRDRCPVIYFEEESKGLVVNKTNMGRMFAAHSVVDTDELAGKRIALYVDHEVSFGGKTTGGIRVRATEPDVPF